jgi:hypothetical protein
MTLCFLCHQHPAALPDRERMGRPIKRVCVECHRERLTRDLEKILEHHFHREMDDDRTF